MARRRHQTPKLKRSRTKDGKGDRWWFRAYVDARLGPGKTDRIEKSHHVGYVADMGVREAQSKMADMVAALNRPAEIIASQVKFAEILDAWLAASDVVPSTRDSYESIAETHLRPKWGEMRLCDIRTAVVEQWAREIARSYAENTVTHIRRTFTQVWNTGLRLEYTQQANPMALIKRPRNFAKSPRAKTLPSFEDFHRFLGELKPMFRDIVIVALGTGMRISEVLALRWRQMGTDCIQVIASKDKFGNVREGVKTENSKRKLPVPSDHIRLSRPIGAVDNDFVFPTIYHLVIYEVKRAGAAVGIDYPGFGMHTFRRMHNTLFRRNSKEQGAEVSQELAQKQLGHADKATNDRYYVEDDYDVAARRAIVEKLMGAVMGGVQ